MSEASFGTQLRRHARERGDTPALTLARLDGTESNLSFGQLYEWSNSYAAYLADRGVDASSSVVISLGNSLEHFVALFASWRLGALVLPMNGRVAERERREMIALLTRPYQITTGASADSTFDEVGHLRGTVSAEVREVVPHPGKAIGSGGSTGRPKIIIDPRPMTRIVGHPMGVLGDAVRFHGCRSQIVPGAIFHNMPFTWSVHGLFEGQHVVVLEHFDAYLLASQIAKHRIEFMTIVPTMMRRIVDRSREVELPSLDSLISMMHSGAPCPKELKRAWFDFVSPERVYEAFGSTEGLGNAIIRGDESNLRPGSVGKPVGATIRVLDDEDRAVPPGEIGEIFMRPLDGRPTYRYVGSSPARTTADGYTSVGDLGWLDEDGYLFCADRRHDLIISGGVNIFPAEVEETLVSHPSVADVVVVGVPDREWGQRLHAVVELRPDSTADASELEKWARKMIAPHKVPRSYEFVERIPRDEFGKIRRSALAPAPARNEESA